MNVHHFGEPGHFFQGANYMSSAAAIEIQVPDDHVGRAH
jgi:hypothetical protein